MTDSVVSAKRVVLLKAALIASLLSLAASPAALAEAERYEQHSEHFTVIYRSRHSHLVPHILSSAESALSRLSELFQYVPSESIIIHTTDDSDYGSAGASTIPRNFIRLAIEPVELGYENVLFKERIQWLLGHELVHVIVNDRASEGEALQRSLFSRVPPEQSHPLSILYSLLTNSSRYSPPWHQEGIAVFMETWLGGGFGRTLGSFDEMYFRSLVLEKKRFPTPRVLESEAVETSFLLGTLHYLYGARFVAYLARTYGAERLMTWYGTGGTGYDGFEGKFERAFGIRLETAWDDFVAAERAFQEANLRTLESVPLTPIQPLHYEPMGWVTQPHVGESGGTVYFGNHQSHRLTAVNRLVVDTGKVNLIGSLPSPSMTQIASTAFDEELGVFFYTTNNNQLYRDLRVLSLASGKSKVLFEDARVGQLTVSARTHELWGVRHSGGRAILVHSPYPYRRLEQIFAFRHDQILQHLAASPSGRFLAATLHQPSGRQAVVVVDLSSLRRGEKFRFQTISEEGSPEFPSWSPDERKLYWNAYTNGVSNIYRLDRETGRVEAMSHCLRGLFRPVFLDADSLFAFEFTSDGFLPVRIPNRIVTEVPAIAYYGQQVLERNPELATWTLPGPEKQAQHGAQPAQPKPYGGLSDLGFHSLIPVVSGFQDRVVVGLFTHLADPLLNHDLKLEIGVSPFGERQESGFHFKGAYEYRKRYRFELEHNAPSFYDLFNRRSLGASGTKATLGHTRYWKYDKPHTVKQTSVFSFHTGAQSINDNLIPISTPEFFSFETSLQSRNVRKSIGGVDSELGNAWKATLLALGSWPDRFRLGAGFHFEWSRYSTWARPHNVLHTQLAGGYLRSHPDSAIGQFYFGGFGNQYLENKEVKQYREVFRFPGIPIYSAGARRFAKVMAEHNLPPLRVRNVGIGSHFLSHVDASWFAQGLMVDTNGGEWRGNLGAQVNLVFTNWSNLESTLSAGVAHAWQPQGRAWEWFVSLKLLRN